MTEICGTCGCDLECPAGDGVSLTEIVGIGGLTAAGGWRRLAGPFTEIDGVSDTAIVGMGGAGDD